MQRTVAVRPRRDRSLPSPDLLLRRRSEHLLVVALLTRVLYAVVCRSGLSVSAVTSVLVSCQTRIRAQMGLPVDALEIIDALCQQPSP
jgi:hypothetical protein